MSFLQISFELGDVDPALAEQACLARGALSITLTDAADEPVLEPAPGETPLWQRVRMSAMFPGEVDGAALAATLAGDLGLPPRCFGCEPVADRAWEREWLRDFRPMRFGRRLWICPGGQAAPDDGAAVVELDPGLAFGTGTHATTAMCLEWLDAADLAGRSVLDYGCGSGVLSLAALRLGASQACAVDIDPQALLATRENAEKNDLAGRLSVVSATALQAGAWDVVLANILAGPLIGLAPALAAHTRPGGDILLAGMLDAQAADVAGAYGPWFHMRQFAERDGWTAICGRRRDVGE